jgi:hypothetical protein
LNPTGKKLKTNLKTSRFSFSFESQFLPSTWND